MSIYSDREGPAWRIVEHLKRNGSATIKELEVLLGLTTTAVRQHLQALQADGYVERKTVHAGVGRPHHAYSITDKVHELFECHCDDLALTLLEEVYAMEGAERASQLLDRVGDRLAARYATSVKSTVMQERVEEFARALHSRGVLTDVESQDEHTITLHTYNCPYHELAQEHQDICEMDKALMSKVLGAEVELDACMMEGQHICSFVVSKEATPQTSVSEAVPVEMS